MKRIVVLVVLIALLVGASLVDAANQTPTPDAEAIQTEIAALQAQINELAAQLPPPTLTFSGSGDFLTQDADAFALPQARLRVHAQCGSDYGGIFEALSVPDGHTMSLASTDDDLPIEVASGLIGQAGSYLLSVNCSGPWSVTIAPL